MLMRQSDIGVNAMVSPWERDALRWDNAPLATATNSLRKPAEATKLRREGRQSRKCRVSISTMQWFFLVLALLAALTELHTGTFYLAGVAVAALATAVLGFWIRDDLLIVVFLLLCALLMAAMMLYRRRSERGKVMPDLDVGQSVLVQSVSQPNSQILVSYRGTSWEAVMDDGAAVVPGDTAIIAGRADKLLHLILPPQQAQS